MLNADMVVIRGGSIISYRLTTLRIPAKIQNARRPKISTIYQLNIITDIEARVPSRFVGEIS